MALKILIDQYVAECKIEEFQNLLEDEMNSWRYREFTKAQESDQWQRPEGTETQVLIDLNIDKMIYSIYAFYWKIGGPDSTLML